LILIKNNTAFKLKSFII